MKKLLIAAGCVAMLTAAATAKAAEPSHASRISAYEGAKTCVKCHPDSAREVAESLHYQQQALPQFLEGVNPDEPVGMMKSF